MYLTSLNVNPDFTGCSVCGWKSIYGAIFCNYRMDVCESVVKNCQFYIVNKPRNIYFNNFTIV